MVFSFSGGIFCPTCKKKKNYGDEKMLSITNQGNANQTTVRYYLSTVRMAVIKETESNKCQ